MANKRRPKRGEPGPDVLVSGDVGHTAGPQGGAATGKDVFRESGDLESREFGVPQADIPGGMMHQAQPQTYPEKPPGVYQRPADYHKYHGVEPIDEGQYETPDPEVGNAPRPAPVPRDKWKDAVPVHIVENPDEPKVIRRATPEMITVVSSAAPNEPTRVCGLDPMRDEVMLLCADPSNDIYFATDEATLLEGRGALLHHSATSYTRIATQDYLYAWSGSTTATALLSVVIVTETQL